MILYGLKQCDTCRKALKVLPDAAFVDVRTEGVPSAVLDRAQAEFGASLINRRSTTWRNLTQEQREMDALSLISENPSVMKRPLIAAGEHLYLGWTPEVQAALLG